MVESESTTILLAGHLGQVEVRVHVGGIDHADIHVPVIHQVRALFPFLAFPELVCCKVNTGNRRPVNHDEGPLGKSAVKEQVETHDAGCPPFCPADLPEHPGYGFSCRPRYTLKILYFKAIKCFWAFCRVLRRISAGRLIPGNC